MAASEIYAAWDVPLRLARTLRRSVRRASLTRRDRLVPGCALLALRARIWSRPSQGRSSLELRWRMTHGWEAPSGRVAPTPALQRASTKTAAAANRTAPTLITVERRVLDGERAPALAALPDWTRLPRSARRRARRAALVSGPLVSAQMAPHLVNRSSRDSAVSTNRLAAGALMRSRVLERTAIGAERVVLRSSEGGSGAVERKPPITHSVVTRGTQAATREQVAGLTGSMALAPSISSQLVGRLVHDVRTHAMPSRSGLASGDGPRPGVEATRPGNQAAHRHSPTLMWRPVLMAALWPKIVPVIEREIARRVSDPASPAPESPSSGADGSTLHADAVPVVSERLVAQVLSRLQAHAREERFRSGRLR